MTEIRRQEIQALFDAAPVPERTPEEVRAIIGPAWGSVEVSADPAEFKRWFLKQLERKHGEVRP